MDKKQIIKILSFLSMSDGNLTMHKGCVNASFHITQREGKDGLIYLASKCLDQLRIGYKICPTYQYKDYTYIRLSSRVHPALTKLWKRIYLDGRKVLDPHAFKQLDWEAIAILYMADGNIQFPKKGRPTAMINLCRLSYPEYVWFLHQVKEKLGIQGNIYKCGKYWRFGFRVEQSEIFFNKIAKYILPEYVYKLPNG